MHLLSKFSLTLLIILFFVSCNLVISNPHTRENPNDPEAVISRFYAFPLNTDKVITTWRWNDDNNNSDMRVEELWLQHSPNDYPEVLNLFSGESISNSSISEFEWTGLDKNTSHYFALHIKDEENNWYAPLFAKATLPGEIVSSFFGFTKALKVDDLNTVVSMTSGIAVNRNSAPNSVLVVELNVPDDIYIISATIETFLTSGGITTTLPLRVYPIIRYWDEASTGGNGYSQLNDTGMDYYVVDDSVSAFIDSGEPILNDITEVVRKALLYDPKQIVFKMDTTGDSTVSVFDASFINIEYISN